MKCSKCGSKNLDIIEKGPHKKLVCEDCFEFQKFLKKGETENFKELKRKKDRKDILLKAAYDILKKYDQGVRVKNAMEVPVTYDGFEGDGFSLMNDIGYELGFEEEE